jgi:hypothetical protein
MNGIVSDRTVLVTCGVLEEEVRSLADAHWPSCKLISLESMLHMRPDKLETALEAVLGEELKQGHGAVLIYGDCCARMAALEKLPGVARTAGVNCCELLLGHSEYYRLLREGAFFLLPEWARRWREVFSSQLGLGQSTAVALMQEMHRKMIYLDTGLTPVPEKELRDCNEYIGLPFEVRHVPLENLKMAIEEALSRAGAWNSA